MNFIRWAWPIIEPATLFTENWHIELIAEYLEAVTAGQIKRLLINCPPHHMKSISVSVCWPVWNWCRSPADKLGPEDILSGPQSRWIFASYADELSTKHSVDRRTIMESAQYKAFWGNRVKFTRDQNMKTAYQNTARGVMIATSVQGSSGLGLGASAIVIDDPHNIREAQSDIQRKGAIDSFRQTLSTRLDNKKLGAIVVIMQRLHEGDLSGYVLETGGWEHLMIQGEFEERRTYVYPRSKQQIVRETDHTDHFRADGALLDRIDDAGLLWPAREGAKEIAERKLNLGSMGFASQYMQRPAPQGGALFKHSWWKYWRILPRCHRIIEVWDTAYEQGDDNSFSNCDVWGFSDIGFVLMDNWHGRVEFFELKRTAIWMASKWTPEAILIEARASGRSLIQELKRPPPVGSNEPALHTSIPIVPIEPEVDKYTRAVAVTPIPEAGLVWLPDPSMPGTVQNPEGYAWVADYQKELELFPAGKLTDRVDTCVHALTYLRGQGALIDFYRRMQHHQEAVDAAEEAQAHGLKPARPIHDNPMLISYARAQEMWDRQHEDDEEEE